MRPSSELIATRNLICSAPRRCVRHRRPRVRPVGAPTLGGPCFRKRCDTLRKSQPNITYSSGRMWIVSVQANIKQQEETYPCLIQTGVSSSLCLIGSLTAQYIYTIPVDYIHGPPHVHPPQPTHLPPGSSLCLRFGCHSLYAQTGGRLVLDSTKL